MKEKVVIVGASIAGANVMSELVKNKFDGKITIIDQNNVLPYNPYPLSKEWMQDADKKGPPLLKKASYYKNHGIDVKLNTLAQSVNWQEQYLTTKAGEEIAYDHLVIATGSKLHTVSLPGHDAQGIFYMRNFADAQRIKAWARGATNVAIIGAGFMGLEFASTFRQMGKEVSVLVRSGKPLDKILGPDAADYFINMHQAQGVEFLFNEETEEFIKDASGKISSIRTKSGKDLACDMVIIAVGVAPNLSLEVEGLKTERGIPVNEYGETNLPNVYAGGDVVIWPYRGRMIHIEHWENAWSQGISIAKNILNRRSSAYRVHPYFWTDQYDQTFEYLGHANPWHEIVVRGSLEERRFALAYLDADYKPLAILFSNKFAKRKDVERLLDRNQALDASKFADLSMDLDQI